MNEFMQYLFSGLTSGAIYAAIAVGFSMLFRSTELINFAHGDFVMMGALSLMTFWSGWHLPLPLALLLAVGLVAAVGLLLERFTMRTKIKDNPIALVIMTVGASIFLRGVAMLVWGKDAHSVPDFIDSPPISIGDAALLPQSLCIILVVLALVAALQFFFRHSLTGKAMQASAVNKAAARLAGIPTDLMVLLAFFMSAAMGAIAGVVIAPMTMSSYDMGTMLGLKGFCAAMLGGLGSIWGAVLGGFLLGVLESFSVGYFMSNLKDLIAFLLLLLILYVRPGGIISARNVKRF